ncbi:MAG: hypothetical protein K2K33_02585 [Muribaculaceae bacterium]|nr:hypothetical protein [Muribaculaceae bacterium]
MAVCIGSIIGLAVDRILQNKLKVVWRMIIAVAAAIISSIVLSVIVNVVFKNG